MESLSVLDGRARPVVNEVSFSLRAGEITCLCGVEGNGQTELLQVVAGMRQPGGGMIQYRLRGRSFQGPVSPGELRHQGVGHIAEDRLRYAVLPDRSLCDNWLMTFLHDRGLVKAGWIKRGQAQQHVDAAIQAYGIKANDSHMLIRQLSGVISRSLSSPESFHSSQLCYLPLIPLVASTPEPPLLYMRRCWAPEITAPRSYCLPLISMRLGPYRIGSW